MYLSKKLRIAFLFIIIILTIGLMTTFGIPSWYKSQIKIIPNQIHGKRIYSNLSLFSTISGLKVPKPRMKTYPMIRATINSYSFIKKLIRNEIPDWDKLFYKNEVTETNREEKLSNLIDRFREDYIHSYEIPKNNLIIIEVNIPENRILCERLTGSIPKYLEDFLSTYNKVYLEEERVFLSDLLVTLNEDFDNIKKKYIYFKETNQFKHSPNYEITNQRYRAQIEMQKTIIADLQTQMTIVRMEIQNNQKYYWILENKFNHVIKHYPARDLLYAITLIIVLFASLTSFYLRQIK